MQLSSDAHAPVELGENVDVHLLRLFVYVLRVSVQVLLVKHTL